MTVCDECHERDGPLSCYAWDRFLLRGCWFPALGYKFPVPRCREFGLKTVRNLGFTTVPFAISRRVLTHFPVNSPRTGKAAGHGFIVRSMALCPQVGDVS